MFSLHSVDDLESGICLSSVHKITKHKFHSYKCKICEWPTENEFDRRIPFCKQLIKLIIKTNMQVMNNRNF